MSFLISVFTDETEGLLDVDPGDEAEGLLEADPGDEAEGLLDADPADETVVLLTVLLVAPPLLTEDVDDVEPTVGMAMLVPEEDPVVDAKAFPETRIPTIAVAIPAFPMAIEMDFFDPFFMFPLLGLRL